MMMVMTLPSSASSPQPTHSASLSQSCPLDRNTCIVLLAYRIHAQGLVIFGTYQHPLASLSCMMNTLCCIHVDPCFSYYDFLSGTHLLSRLGIILSTQVRHRSIM